MRIHVSKSVDHSTLADAVKAAYRAGHGFVFLQSVPTEHGSRTHAHAFEVKLEGDGTSSRRRVNQGTRWNREYGDDVPYAATYDSWGWFLAHLYSVDPTMIAGPYKGVDDFHARTRFAYAN